jgi:Ubiquinone biosynthesis protein COQ7
MHDSSFLKIITYKDEAEADESLTKLDKEKSISLMRVNASGEVSAQALYRGQAFFSKTPEVKEHLIKAGDEEFAHLEWCTKRLEELGGKKSLLDPLYYAGSFTLGSVAALIGDGTSLGFVEETEKQVVEHLKKHLEEMSPNDKKSREILERMLEEEEIHGQEAKDHGSKDLPAPVKGMMTATSKIMTTLSRYI